MTENPWKWKWSWKSLGKVIYSQTSLIRTSLIRMICNPNTFSWERIFIVLFVLLNPDVTVSGSGQAWFQQTLFLVYNFDGLIWTPTTLRCSWHLCDTGRSWRVALRNNYRPLARRLVGEGVTRGCDMSQARGLATQAIVFLWMDDLGVLF